MKVIVSYRWFKTPNDGRTLDEGEHEVPETTDAFLAWAEPHGRFEASEIKGVWHLQFQDDYD